jgi:phosphoglycolate phosphatase
MITTFIFDLDGTLINSLDDLADSCNYALSQLGYPQHPVEAYKYIIGDGVLKLLERILPKEKSFPAEIEKIRKIQSPYYAMHCFDKTKPYDGIMDLLEELKQRGYKLAVVSNKPDENTKTIVSHFFRKDLFDIITGKRDGYAPKPDPTLTQEMIVQLGQTPEECAFVGDSGMDILTAVHSNTLPIGVTWGFRQKTELLENGAEYIVDHPKEIVRLNL